MLKKSGKWLVIALVSVLGLATVATALYRRLAARKNPEYWIRFILGNEGFGQKEISYWVALSKHESGNYTNDLTKYYNIFSMAVPKKRESLRNGQVWNTGDKQYMSTYDSYKTAVLDLVIWVKYTKFPIDINNLDEFVSTLKKDGYFTANAEIYKNGLLRYLAKDDTYHGGSTDTWIVPLLTGGISAE